MVPILRHIITIMIRTRIRLEFLHDYGRACVINMYQSNIQYIEILMHVEYILSIWPILWYITQNHTLIWTLHHVLSIVWTSRWIQWDHRTLYSVWNPCWYRTSGIIISNLNAIMWVEIYLAHTNSDISHGNIFKLHAVSTKSWYRNFQAILTT